MKIKVNMEINVSRKKSVTSGLYGKYVTRLSVERARDKAFSKSPKL